MRIRIPTDQYQFVQGYLEDRGYGIVSVRPKKDDFIIIAKRIHSNFFLDGAAEMTAISRTSRENILRSRRPSD